MKAKLPPKRERFCQEYLVDLNATQAAIRAGYSAKTAEVQGPRLLGNVWVAGRIRELQEKRAERLEVKADRVLAELAVLAFSNLEHYTVGDDGKVVLAPDAPKAAMRAVASIKHRIERDRDGKLTRTVELRLWDKPASMRLAAQHLGMLVEKHEHSGPGGGPIEHAEVTMYMPTNGRDPGLARVQSNGKAVQGNGRK